MVEPRISGHNSCIYVLHITEKDGSTWHYIGMTRSHRLKTRLRQHQLGHGAISTRRAAARGATMEIFPIHTNANWEDELDYILMGSKAPLCPLCHPPPQCC